MDVPTQLAEELSQMLDDGISLEVHQEGKANYVLSVIVDDAACAECLVPDSVLADLAAGALDRRGVRVDGVRVQHQA